jgi:hypothetical protein
VPYSVIVLANGWVFVACDHIIDKICCYTTYQAAAFGNPLKAYEPRIKCSILTTVVTAVDPTVHLRLPASGNLISNPGFTDVTHDIDGYIPPSSRSPASILLRNKPANWGAMAVASGDWNKAATTDMFTTTNQSGMTVITTAAGCTNAGTAGVGYVNDPTPDVLYVPLVWGGLSTGLTGSDEVEYLCSPSVTADVTPVIALKTAQIAGPLNAIVSNVTLPRVQTTGDYVTLSFTYWMHLLYKIQNQPYDTRLMRVFAFMQFLDADAQPIQVLNQSQQPMFNSHGSPLYHFDWAIGDSDNTDARNTTTATTPSVVKPTHKYLTWGPTPFAQSLILPAATRKVRVGFIGGVRSASRQDNMLSDVGESGGIFVNNVSLVLVNSLRP